MVDINIAWLLIKEYFRELKYKYCPLRACRIKRKDNK